MENMIALWNSIQNRANATYQKQFKQVEYIYGLRNDENVRRVLDFAESLEREGKTHLANGETQLAEEQTQLAETVLTICEELYMEPFKLSSTLYYDHMMPSGPLDLNVSFRHDNDHAMKGFLATQKVNNCGEYGIYTFNKLLEMNTLHYKKTGQLMFLYPVIISAAPDHRFNLIITHNNRIIMIDNWHNNLICEFTAENLARFGSLSGIRDFRITRYKDFDGLKMIHQNTHQIKLPESYNPFRLPDDKLELVHNRINEINHAFRTDRGLQQILMDRANEDIQKMCEYTTERHNAKYFYTNRLEGNLAVFQLINESRHNEDKVIPNNSLDEYGVIAMIALDCENFTDVKEVVKAQNNGEFYDGKWCKKFVLANIEDTLETIKKDRDDAIVSMSSRR